MIEFVYFDLDDTLLDHQYAQRRALEDCHRDFAGHFGGCPLERVQEVFHTHNIRLWEQYSLAEIGKDDLQRLRFEQLLKDLEIGDLPWRQLGEQYMRRYSHHWRWIEGAEAAFHAVAAQYPVGVITNGFADVQRAKLEAFPNLAARLRASVVSEEVGYMKPHPEVFAHAAAKAQATPAHLLYIGDSFTSDVQGGLNAGWHVAWFTEDASRAPEVFSFSDWRDLLAMLDVT